MLIVLVLRCCVLLYNKNMLDIKLLREEPEKVKSAIKLKDADPKLVDNFLELDGGWKRITGELDDLRHEQKELSGKEERDIDAAKGIKEKIKVKEAELAELEGERLSTWLKIPNLSSEDTPVGKDEESNKFLRSWGEPRKFSAQGGSPASPKRVEAGASFTCQQKIVRGFTGHELRYVIY